MMGAPAFVCWLIPVYSLKHDHTLEHTHKVIDLLHENESFAFLLVWDNLRVNQACSNLYKEKLGSSNIFSCKHTIYNKKLESFYLLYDPTHFFRNIRQTEEMHKLQLTNPR